MKRENPAPTRLKGPVVWCPVNFSEGRRCDVIEAILAAISSESDAVLADWSADSDHNRMVATLLGGVEPVCRAVSAACAAAVNLIDLRNHSGVHPRAGAVDVIPLVPVRGVSIEECISGSRSLGEDISAAHSLPIYLYELSARHGRRTSLSAIRKGGFEALSTEPLTGERAPDFGPSEPHPSAGIAVIGARDPLVAYNVNLASTDADIARAIASDVRRDRLTDPALTGVRALGLALPGRGISQVSLNVTQPHLTPIPNVFRYVRTTAEELGTSVIESEVIGLIPRGSLGDATPEDILWRGFRPGQILENWLQP